MILRKLIFAFMCLIMVGSLLVGCGTPAPTTGPETVDDTPVPEMPDTPPVDVTWHTVLISAEQADVDMVNEAATEMLQAKGVNVNFKFVAYDWASFGEKAPLMLSSGEPCDIVFTASWSPVNFFNMSQDEVFMPLDDLLQESAPGLWASMTPAQWDAGRGTLGGPITAVPNMAMWSAGGGMSYRCDLLEKYPFEGWGGNDTIISVADWEPYIEDVLSKETDLAYWTTNAGNIIVNEVSGIYHSVLGTYDNIVVRWDDENRKIVSLADQDEFMAGALRVREWVEKEWVPAESTQLEQETAYFEQQQLAARLDFFEVGQYGAPSPYAANMPLCGRWTYPQYLQPARLVSSMSGVCASSEHPKEAVQVLEMANTDRDFYNLLAYGVEGYHWDWVDKGKELFAFSEEHTGYKNQHWMLGSVYNAFYYDENAANNKGYDVSKKLMTEEPPASVLIGFIFDPTPVETELATCKASWTELYGVIKAGQRDDVETAVAELQAAMEACGEAKILTEAQKQVDAWVAGK